MSSKTAKEKNRLKKIIMNMASQRERFVNCFEKDFTRNRKLSFESVLSLVLTLNGGSTAANLLEYFKFSQQTSSTSAFVQQRSKLKPEALEYLFYSYTRSASATKTFNDYRLLAVDGSDLQIPPNPNDEDSYYPGANGQKHYNLLHLNALFDLENRIYLDALVQKSRHLNENLALNSMVDRSSLSGNVIILADRGYESYNNLAHIQEKGWNFLIRIKDGNHGIASGLNRPCSEEFDLPVDLNITRKNSVETRHLCQSDRNRFKLIAPGTPFDFLPSSCCKNDPAVFFNLKFRIVRFKLSDSTYESVVTNLPSDIFPASEIKVLYARRWGIETAFRHLKHTIGLDHFYSKKAEHIHQEIFARLTMYNFTELITSLVITRRAKRKYTYSVNFSAAAHICRNFFLDNVTPPEVEALLSRLISPARPGRSYPRKKKK